MKTILAAVLLFTTVACADECPKWVTPAHLDPSGRWVPATDGVRYVMLNEDQRLVSILPEDLSKARDRGWEDGTAEMTAAYNQQRAEFWAEKHPGCHYEPALQPPRKP